MAPHRRRTLRQWKMHREDLQSRAIRRDFRTYLDEISSGNSDGDAAEIIFGELVANAMEHGAGTITACVCSDGASLFLCIADEGPGFVMPEAGPMDALESERGRGLSIVRSLSKDVRVARERGSFVEAKLPMSLQGSERCA